MAAYDTGDTIINTSYIISVSSISKSPTGPHLIITLVLHGRPAITLHFPDERAAKEARQKLFDLIDAGAGAPL